MGAKEGPLTFACKSSCRLAGLVYFSMTFYDIWRSRLSLIDDLWNNHAIVNDVHRSRNPWVLYMCYFIGEFSSQCRCYLCLDHQSIKYIGTMECDHPDNLTTFLIRPLFARQICVSSGNIRLHVFVTGISM